MMTTLSKQQSNADTSENPSLQRRDSDGGVEDDPFWQVAFDEDGGLSSRRFVSLDDDCDMSGRSTMYRIPGLGRTLTLESLAEVDGIWSPVGGDVWYSSAILAAIMIQSMTGKLSSVLPPSTVSQLQGLLGDICNIGDNNNSSNNHGSDDDGRAITVLEIGSGAVALSGFACACASTYQAVQTPTPTPTQTSGKTQPHATSASTSTEATRTAGCDSQLQEDLEKDQHLRQQQKQRIILSDNDRECLSQLRRNVDSNGMQDSVHVREIDWGDCAEFFEEEEHIDLVIGSELIYTKETGDACTAFVQTIFDRYPTCAVLIVQVVDRFGWEEIFMPSIQRKRADGKELVVKKIDISLELHDVAAQMVQPGGTLDLSAFGAVLIRRADRQQRVIGEI